MHAIDDLARVLAVRARAAIGAHDDLQVAVLRRHLEHRKRHRDALFHELEAGVVVIADAEEARLVLDVVLQEQAGLRLEIGAALAIRRASASPI